MTRKLFILLSCFLFPCRLLAWGHSGHQMVAELAMDMLSDATRVKVERVLNGMTPAEAGTWMDNIRDDPKYKYTAPWHFVNIEKGGTYKPAPKGDIITALNKAYTELQHMDQLTPEQVKFDVLVLFHLCGDLMQPLHVGYGSDKGGNTYQVQYNGRGTNLHHIWDTDIIEKEHITLADLGSSKITGAQPVSFMTWLMESRGLLSQVYYTKNHKVDDSYLKMNKQIVVDQLYLGGKILGVCLETLFGNVSTIGVGPDISSSIPNRKPVKRTQPGNRTGTITPDQAAAHVGEQVTVCGKVSGTRLLDNGPTFLNMGGEYPNNPFTAVIMFNKRGNFSYKPEEYLNGKIICVTGVVKDYKGKPEIVVDNEEQVRGQ